MSNTKYAPAMTLEQWEMREANASKKVLSRDTVHDKERSVFSNYKKLEALLTKHKMVLSKDNGDLWVKTVRADLSEVVVNREKGSITNRVLQVRSKTHKRGIRTITTGEYPEWVCVGYDEGVFFVWQHEKTLFTCEKKDLHELPIFLKAFFSSKYGHGKLIIKD